MLFFTSKTINFLDASLYIYFYFSAFIPTRPASKPEICIEYVSWDLLE